MTEKGRKNNIQKICNKRNDKRNVLSNEDLCTTLRIQNISECRKNLKPIIIEQVYINNKPKSKVTKPIAKETVVEIEEAVSNN